MNNIKQTTLTPDITGDSVNFDREQCLKSGQELNATYTTNDPYPHIVIDNFLPVDCLRRVVDEFPKRQAPRFTDDQSNLKTGYQMEMIESSYITNLLNALNSSQFVDFLEELSGIQGLIPDPHFSGGGLHETARGGHLSIHADFNILRKLNLRRRLNLILFLNENWKEEYGGHLELWSKDMKECCASVNPAIGRVVIFNTETDSFHGHPEPTTSPPDVYRRSMALYYYTSYGASINEKARTTDFRVRPGSQDKRPPMKTRAREIMDDLTPPVISRWLNR